MDRTFADVDAWNKKAPPQLKVWLNYQLGDFSSSTMEVIRDKSAWSDLQRWDMTN